MVLTQSCLTCQIPQLHNGVMLANSEHNGGRVGAQERMVTPGEGRTLSTLASDEHRMNARFEERLCHFHLRKLSASRVLPEVPAGGLKTTVDHCQWVQQ